MKFFLASLLFLSCACAQVASLSLAGPATVPPNASVPLSAQFTAGATPATALQWKTTPTLTWTLTPALVASKQISCAPATGLCIVFGLNTTPIPSSVIATASATAPASGNLTASVSQIAASSAAGLPVTVTAGPTLTIPVSLPGDHNNDGRLTSVDVTIIVNESIGLAMCNTSHDMDGDGVCGPTDVQLTVNLWVAAGGLP